MNTPIIEWCKECTNLGGQCSYCSEKQEERLKKHTAHEKSLIRVTVERDNLKDELAKMTAERDTLKAKLDSLMKDLTHDQV